MALPTQVQKQSEEVQALYKELNGETTEVQAESAEATEKVSTEAPVKEPSDSAVEQAPQSEANEQSKSDTKNKEETWQQKYKSLQGMYNADVPRLNSQNRELASRISQLEGLLGNMQNQPIQTPSVPSEPLITEDDVKEYGDSIDIMRKAAREEVATANSRMATLENQIRQLQGVVPQVQQVQAQQKQTNEQAFWASISRAVPNWNEINTNNNFQNWLLETDPLTGITRQTYLEDAQKQLDSGRVINFFKLWQEGNGSQNTAQPNRKVQNSQLEKQVAPGRSRSNGATVSGEPPTYSSDDIKTFFNDVRMGKYKGREDERGRIERDIFAAQREGRIVTAN